MRAKLIAEAQSKQRDIEAAIADLRQERERKLLSDIDAGREPEAEKIDARIRDLAVEADGTRDLIAALERRAGEEQNARAVKQRAAQIERVEGMLQQRVKIGRKLEDAVGSMVKLTSEDMRLSKAIAAAWPWDTGKRAALKLHGQGIRALLCAELYRQSALAFINNIGDDQIAMPGSVCPRDEWRLQPDKIPALVSVLEEISAFGSRTLRNQPAPKPPAPKPSASAQPKPVPQTNSERAAVDTKSAPMVRIEEAQMQADVAAAERRQKFGET